MTTALDEYRAALQRLIERGDKISNDAVSLEAGRKKGSIKSGRAGFSGLINEISAAESRPKGKASPVSAGNKAAVSEIQGKLDASLAREVSLIREVRNLRRQLAKLRGGTVVPILKGRRSRE